MSCSCYIAFSEYIQQWNLNDAQGFSFVATMVTLSCDFNSELEAQLASCVRDYFWCQTIHLSPPFH